jgi:ankyrin repeat protein
MQRGKLALHWAAQFGDAHMLQRMLAADAPKLQARDVRGNTPLHLAAAAGHMWVPGTALCPVAMCL